MKINQAKKLGVNKVSVIFDSGEQLVLSYDIFMKSGLRKNDNISEDRFLLLQKENSIHLLKQKAFKLLGRRVHSAFELKTKLRNSAFHIDHINEVISYLRTNNYLDDAAFAESFTEEKIRLKKWGQGKVRSELIKRGISREIIDQTILKHFSGSDINLNALELAKKKFSALKVRESDTKKLRQKLIQFLMMRGYEYEKCREAVDELLS